jgi:uncharacterized protein (DUF302 family)
VPDTKEKKTMISKKHQIVLMLVLSVLLMNMAYAGDGLIKKPSQFSVNETADRMEKILDSKAPISLMARVDHHANAQSVDLELGPMVLLIFGNPKLGTQLMQENPTTGIDLPMKLLVWEDAQGKVWVAYNDPKYLAKRHGLKNNDAVIEKMSGALNAMSDKATGKE